VRSNKFQDRISLQMCSFMQLNEIEDVPYDAVFSNLGGLNCISNLSPVIDQLPLVLKTGGLVIWVIMPPVCLWEIAELLRGHPRLAFRRLAKGGTRAHLEGLHFQVYYFSPSLVLDWFGSDYELLDLEGLSVLTPTAESKNFAIRHPKLYRALAWLDDRISGLAPFQGWGDFYILTLRRRR
jgi:hypothetical protein